MTEDFHTSCPHPREGALLVDYFLGQLGEQDAVRFEEHLMNCAFCQEEAAELEPLLTTMRTHREAVLTEFSRQKSPAHLAEPAAWLASRSP